MNKVTALSVLSNAVLAWNSVRFAEIVAGLEATTGNAVAVADLARVSPLANAHVIPSGPIDSPRLRGPWSNISFVGAWDPEMGLGGSHPAVIREANRRLRARAA